MDTTGVEYNITIEDGAISIFGLCRMTRHSRTGQQQRRSGRIAFLSLSIVGLVLMPLQPAHSSEWTYVAINTALNRIYIDLDSLEVDGPVVTYSVKSAESKTGAYRVDRLSMNCREGKSLRKGSAAYDGNDRLTESRPLEEKELDWEPIAPDTIMDFFRKMLCLNGEPRKNVKDHLRGWGEFLKKQIDREGGDR